MAESLMAKNFGKFASTFSPSLSGGFLNVAFKPVQTNNGSTLLDVNNFNMDTFVKYAKDMFLSTKQSHPVLDVLPADIRPSEVKNSTYLIQIILLGVAFLITLGMVFGVLIIPCTWCCCRKRSKGKTPSRICYIVLLAISGAFLLYLSLCLPLVFVSITSLASGIDGNSSKADNRGFKETFAVVVTETSSFLRELPRRGRTITDELIQYAQKSLEESLGSLVKGLLDKLLVEYGVRTLIANARILSENVTVLQNITDYLVKETTTTLAEVDAFQDRMKKNKEGLENNLKNICANAPSGTNQCQELQDKLTKLTFNFNSQQVNLDQTLINLISTFGGNLTEVLQKFDDMEKNVDSQIQNIIQEIQNNFNLAKELQALTKIWDQVTNDVSNPIIKDLNQMKPTVDDTLSVASKYIKIGGYAVLALFSVVLVILLINWIIIVVQAALSRTPSSTAITAQMVCGLIIPAILCFLVPLLVLVGGAVILVTGLISNEGCRYIGNPNGVAITDGATNLYLQYMWPTQFEQHLSPDLRGLVDVPIPQNVLDGILVKCQGLTENATSTSPAPGFLPSLGVDHFLNASAALDQPQLKQAIKNAETELVNKIVGLDFANMLKLDIPEIQDLITKVEDNLKKANYQTTVEELRKGIIDPDPINKLLDELESFIKQIPSNADTQDTERIIKEMRVDLQKTGDLQMKIQTLIDAFEALQQNADISAQLTAFSNSLQYAYGVLTNTAELEKPIKSAYQEKVNDAMQQLVGILEKASDRFTNEVITCENINKIATSVVGATCADDGLFNRLGAFFFMLLLFLCPLELTVMLFQISVKTHGKMVSE